MDGLFTKKTDDSKTYSSYLDRTIALAGVVVAAVSCFVTSDQSIYYIVPPIIVTQFALLYFSYIHIKITDGYKAKEKELVIQIDELKKEITTKNKNLIDQKKAIIDNISCIALCLKNEGKLNNFIFENLSQYVNNSYIYSEAVARSKKSKEQKQKLLADNFKNYQISLYEIYKRYTTNMLTSLKEILENYLCICGYSVSVSLTVKLFNKKYISTEEFRDLKVYTAFRDRASYDQGKREIQDRVFTVMGNTDFLQCLKKEHFIKK